jgi:hypothetical protein
MPKKYLFLILFCFNSNVALSAGACIGTPIKDNFIGNILINFWNHCRGSYTDSKGDEYIGKYNDGKIISDITVIESGGSVYKGGLKDKRYNGKGEIVYPNGDKYSGFWKNSKYDGKGEILFKNGIKLKSEFKEGFPQVSHNMSAQNRYIGNLMSYCISSERSSQGSLSTCINDRDQSLKEIARLEYEANLKRQNQINLNNRTKGKKKSSFGEFFKKTLKIVGGVIVAGVIIDQIGDMDPSESNAFFEALIDLNARQNRDFDYDWDYLPGNNQWRCRGIQTGQFANDNNCLYDKKDDSRWPN